MCNCSSNSNNNNNKKKKKKHKHKNNKKNKNKNKNKNKSGLEQFGNYKAAQKLGYVPLARTYVVCNLGEALLAAANLSTHPHVSFTAFSACDSIHELPCLTLVLCGCMFVICPPFCATRSTLPFSWGLITLSASLCCSGPSASLYYQPCSNLCCQHKLLSLTATNAQNPKGIAGVRSSTMTGMNLHRTNSTQSSFGFVPPNQAS